MSGREASGHDVAVETGDVRQTALGRLTDGPWLLPAFALGHLLLVMSGYGLKESIAYPAVMWPAAGLAWCWFWLTPLRLWPVLLLVQFAVEFGVAALWVQPFTPGLVGLYTLASLAGAAVGAGFGRLTVPQRVDVRVRHLAWFLVASAAGSLVNALIGSRVNQLAFGDPAAASAWLQHLQIWWAGNWLGCLAVVPALLMWRSPLRQRYSELALRSRAELACVAAALILVCVHVFYAVPSTRTSLLQTPAMVAVVMLYAAVRLQPRWTALLSAVAMMLCAWLVALGRGPFQNPDIFHRTAEAQTYLATISIGSIGMALLMAEKNIAMEWLRESDRRYRNFVELSTEALWRVELRLPMAVTLPPAEQTAWLRAHARVEEFSHSYGMIDADARQAGAPLAWRPEVPWIVAYEDCLLRGAHADFSADGFRFTVDIGGRCHTFLAALNAVVEDGRLLRVWGVARDVTELAELNEKLRRKQQRLTVYARQLITAEERARRATAVDLHDGIGQSLAGIGITLGLARPHTTPEGDLLVGEALVLLREVQERTRHMISDLSPPGLYDLGLTPALQWLAVSVRKNDDLHVELDADLREDAVKLDTRVLVFKLVRELLRNVTKHAGVNAARVKVRGDSERLVVEVSDRGKGFEWQMEVSGARDGGFGLWSIAERVSEVGGQFKVDTAPGRGSCFVLTLPLMQGQADGHPSPPLADSA